RHKTGALITLAVTSPAVLKGAEPDVMDCLIRYSEAIGLCFQVVDDILDIEGDESLGKPIGSDQAKNKSTYPALLGLDGAKKEAKRLLEVALASLTSFDERADPLRAIARFIAERRN
ncbi:MAG TPA: polyprenyl synthetase family protein, partial [bacterium]|nr:polyprenyl synthetase family protein [bacterium]